MYCAADHIGIKLDQDRVHCQSSDKYMLLALCDGIGEFKESGRVADLMVEAIHEEMPEDRHGMERAIRTALEDIKREDVKGGTTLLCAYRKEDWPDGEVAIQHLGNGAILHLAGDYHDLGSAEHPYRYRHVILPHVDAHGALMRHVSHNSGASELALSETRLLLNAPHGDLLLFVTDGIAALEESMIIRNEDGAYWRYEFGPVQYILSALGDFLMREHDVATFQERLGTFITTTLSALKDQGQLEDDASLGILVTDQVLQYHRKQQGQ